MLNLSLNSSVLIISNKWLNKGLAKSALRALPASLLAMPFARIEMKSSHSEILIHWTSRELSKKSSSDAITQDEYVILLYSIYSRGLKFSSPKEPDIVVGVNCRTEIPTLPIICFTELHLSHAQEHAKQYGSLGIGFNREFLMKWGANPVFYMQSKNQGIVNTNLSRLTKLKSMHVGLDVFLSYVKPMGAPNSDQYFYYDEFEWRMVACKLGNQWPERFVESDGDIWFKFKPSEVSLIAWPNEATRRKGLADPKLADFFNDHMPMIVDTSDCQAF